MSPLLDKVGRVDFNQVDAYDFVSEGETEDYIVIVSPYVISQDHAVSGAATYLIVHRATRVIHWETSLLAQAITAAQYYQQELEKARQRDTSVKEEGGKPSLADVFDVIDNDTTIFD